MMRVLGKSLTLDGSWGDLDFSVPDVSLNELTECYIDLMVDCESNIDLRLCLILSSPSGDRELTFWNTFTSGRTTLFLKIIDFDGALDNIEGAVLKRVVFGGCGIGALSLSLCLFNSESVLFAVG